MKEVNLITYGTLTGPLFDCQYYNLFFHISSNLHRDVYINFPNKYDQFAFHQGSQSCHQSGALTLCHVYNYHFCVILGSCLE